MSWLSEDYVIIDKAGDMHKGRLSTGSQKVMKELLIEMIGDDEEETKTDKSDTRYHFNSNKRRRNKLRAELRKKVNEL